jgi:hypothetical protein
VVTLGDDVGTGSVWSIVVEDPADRRLIAPGLSDFFKTIASRWDGGAYYVNPVTGLPTENLAKLAAERRAKDKRDIDVLTLVDNLASDDARARAHSMRLLKEFLYPEAVEPLVALLSHPNQMIRRDAASLLGQIGDPKAIPALSRALDDSDSAVRSMIEWALAELGRRRPT